MVEVGGRGRDRFEVVERGKFIAVDNHVQRWRCYLLGLIVASVNALVVTGQGGVFHGGEVAQLALVGFPVALGQKASVVSVKIMELVLESFINQGAGYYLYFYRKMQFEGFKNFHLCLLITSFCDSVCGS